MVRTKEPARRLNADEVTGHIVTTSQPPSANSAETADIQSHPLYLEVLNCIDDGFAGVILTGSPGTGKSHMAAQIAAAIAGDQSRVRLIQFHPSFQYEDFIEGWVSDGKGAFLLKPKHFLLLAKEAEENPEQKFVLVIDEISRCDAVRVFGEALTYLETSKRGIKFSLASGNVISVPDNLLILATMNPWDVTVDALDFALERRFAFIEMNPDVGMLADALKANGMSSGLVTKVLRFFEFLQKRPNYMLHIGHAYFMRAKDLDSLQRVWRVQVRPHVAKVTRLETAELQAVENAWRSIVEAQDASEDQAAGTPVAVASPGVGDDANVAATGQ